MEGVNTNRHMGIGLAALLVTAALFATSVGFAAPRPGADLVPLDGAETVIDLIQGNQALLWSSLSGPVSAHVTLGWPKSDGTHELGGALIMELPADARTGVIVFGEKPMTVEFSVG